ncbi:MAG: HNH endonuclease [Actinomycetota bacterium]|nr:HNH endonuclease [Actinomycetota bacterium]
MAKALQERADRFPATPGGEADSRTQRQADALVAFAQDWLDTAWNTDGTTTNDDIPAGYGSTVTIFADAAQVAASGGELGGTVAGGPRIGPETLQRMLCEAAVSVVGVAGGRPVTTTARTRAIPPAIRDFVLQRDGGCVIDGCTSRYRLQPHHVTPYAEGGDHDPATLATLCWYHHHIVIHGYGYRLDLDTPPQRRRLTNRPIRPSPQQAPPDSGRRGGQGPRGAGLSAP